MIGFSFSQFQKTIWIDPEENPKKIFCYPNEYSYDLSEDEGEIQDFYKDGEFMKVKTSSGIFNLELPEMKLVKCA